MKKQSFEIDGMTCTACANAIEREVGRLEGIDSVAVNFASEKMQVSFDENLLEESDLKHAVSKAGYAVVERENKGSTTTSEESNPAVEHMLVMKKRLIWSAIFTLPVFYLAMGPMIGMSVPGFLGGEKNILLMGLTQLLLTIPVAAFGWHFYRTGFKTLFKGHPNMDSLIAVGTAAALLYGVFVLYQLAYALSYGDMDRLHRFSHDLYFESAAVILTLITMGKYLEARAKGKTSEAIKALMDLTPPVCLVERGDGVVSVPTSEVQVGDVIQLKPGSKVPVDGVIIEGGTAMDESMLTGESLPVEKTVDDKLMAGSLSQSGFVRMKATSVGEDTVIAKIIRLVEEAQGSKAPIAKLADTISLYFVPIVIGISIITLAVWLFLGEGFEFAFRMAISVLVISCPCALGLATPTAIMVGTGIGAKHGILIKSGEALERMQAIDTIVFDKTGTLTEGKPEVVSIDAYGDKEELLSLSGSLESRSEHPLSTAIVREMEKEGMPLRGVEDFEAVFGQGVRGTVDGTRILIGNDKLMATEGIDLSRAEESVSKAADLGQTSLMVVYNGELQGIIHCADTVKASAAEGVRVLKSLGKRVVMLTGDKERTAKAIAGELGIDDIIAEVMPDHKGEAIKERQRAGQVVMMVGDGINDAVALVQADIGLAIGNGTDVAIESADVVLMQENIGNVATAMSLSRRTLRTIKQNLFWAFIYNVIGIPLAAGVLYYGAGLRLNPMIAAAAMSFSSVSVVSNALRLKGFKAPKEKIDSNSQITSNEEGVTNMKKFITIEGMSCMHCVKRVTEVLSEIEGVEKVEVSLERNEAVVEVAPSVNDKALKEAVEHAGYDVVDITV